MHRRPTSGRKQTEAPREAISGWLMKMDAVGYIARYPDLGFCTQFVG